MVQTAFLAMAPAVVGELIPFTLRTVYVVPVVYTFLENSERRQAYGSPEGTAVRGSA